MSVNKVILVGRLGQNPEVRYTAGGAAVAHLNLATHEAWVDKAGQKQEKTEWHRVVTWGKTAENCGQYLSKGRQVYVEGRLQTRQWQDKEGQTRYTTEINAQSVLFLGAGGAAQSPGTGIAESESGVSSQQAAQFASSMPQSSAPVGEPAFTEDDIPF